MTELKIVQRRQEIWSIGIEVFFLLVVIATGYPYVYVSFTKTMNYLNVPMFLLLNGVMLYSVIKTRFTIKSMPNLFPNENLVVVHVLLFTIVSGLWVVQRVYHERLGKAQRKYYDDETYDNWFLWLLASADFLLPNLAYDTANTLLNLFMLYMLHKFSIFEGFVYDPITKKNVPMLSMFMTASSMEKGLKDRVLSDKERAQIKQLLDYEEAQETFAASASSASIAGSLVGNDLGESMRSLRRLSENVHARYSTDASEFEDDLSGEALQLALKGEPIPGSLGDDNY